MSNWIGVPEEKSHAWRDAFDVRLGCGVNVRQPCPLCGAQGLRRYYGRSTDEPRQVEGIAFSGKGAGWEWCFQCKTFEHFSGLVPRDWVPPAGLGIDEFGLTAAPEGLAQAIENRPGSKYRTHPHWREGADGVRVFGVWD